MGRADSRNDEGGRLTARGGGGFQGLGDRGSGADKGTGGFEDCDVGKTLPIGAYLFNPAAANTSVNGQTFTEWFIDDYLFGPNGGANPNISGFFFDGRNFPC